MLPGLLRDAGSLIIPGLLVLYGSLGVRGLLYVAGSLSFSGLLLGIGSLALLGFSPPLRLISHRPWIYETVMPQFVNGVGLGYRQSFCLSPDEPEAR